jgi:hypothetical protein
MAQLMNVRVSEVYADNQLTKATDHTYELG